jgi:hypothetical protein
MNRLSDGCFFVDNGLIEHITTCPWKAYAAFILSRRTAGESAALRFGRHIHTALAYRNKMDFYQKNWSEETQVKILENRFSHTPLEDEGWRNFDSAVKVIKGYNRNSSLDTIQSKLLAHPKTGFPLVEQPFAIDTHRTILGWRIIYIGRIDRIVKFQEGPFVRDYKTTSMLGDTTWSEAQMSEQLKGYCWAYRETFGEEPVGFCYDALAVRESIANAIWDDVLGKIICPPTKSGKESKAVPLEFASQRFFTKEPPGQLDEWFENMLGQVETFLWHVQRNRFDRYHTHCRHKYGLCEFFNVCSLPARSREAALASNAFKMNEWTPLYRK